MGVPISKDQNGHDHSNSAETTIDYAKRTKEIDAELLREQKANAKVIKLLLLGTSECGKSTVVKQMRILHSHGFSDNEAKLHRCSIYENILNVLAVILQAIQTEKMKLSCEDREADVLLVLELKQSGSRISTIPAHIAAAMERLWHEKAVHQIFLNAERYQLPDSASYFLCDLDRICSQYYVPTQQDILRLRVATTGISEVEFTMKNIKYRVFDVGGQRSERRKWIHCFDNVNAIIYVAALSDYNMTLVEDNHTWFLNTPTLLFLNKRDLFMEKILVYPLTIAFPEYTGPNTYPEACTYVQRKYIAVNKTSGREIYVHKTCATDTKDMEFVFEACFDIISRLSMRKSGLM